MENEAAWTRGCRSVVAQWLRLAGDDRGVGGGKLISALTEAQNW
jgi:hypothetical protein